MTTQSDADNRVRNIRIRQTYIEEQIASAKSEYGYDTDSTAFVAVATGLIFDVDYGSLEDTDVVDGAGDRQIDFIRIEDDDRRAFAHIHIVQAKTAKGFSSTTLVQLKNGLDWVFERPQVEYAALGNPSLIHKIEEIRQLRLRYGVSNLAVSVYFVTLGDTKELSAEFLEEQNVLVQKYTNVGFREFNFRPLGAYELVDLLNESERSARNITVDIPVVYDVNLPSVIQYSAGDTNAIICTITGEALAQVASTEPRDAIFDLNVRPFYGSRGRVNSDIQNTCTSEESSRFWFLNNGITMTCSKFEFSRDPDQTVIRVHNAQIVNGCQTSITIREAWENGSLRRDVRVLLRIYATDNPNLTERITRTTNNQNQITDRDLFANDDVQRDIQRGMEGYEYYYERKNKQYRGITGQGKKRIVPNYKAAQAYLAIVRRKPSQARGYLGKIWSEYYSEIFDNATVEDLLLCYLIYSYCVNLAKTGQAVSDIEREIRVYGVFHLARVIGKELLDDEWGTNNRRAIIELIQRVDLDQSVLEVSYQKAMKFLLRIRNKSRESDPNPTLYYKANDIQRSIEARLAEVPVV